MKIMTTVAEMQEACREIRARGATPGAAAALGVVPTMGALHEGHLSLVRRARAECGVVAASIFVNPLQFGPNEDFAKYPRTFEGDVQALEREGVALLFAPAAAEMYPAGAVTTVTVAGVGDRLDGASRPGHFTGVATVVAKLFHIFGQGRFYFGQKDAAQVAVLRQMAKDLNFDVELAVCAIVREADGLALSSRNRYLSEDERRRALVLSRALRRVEERIAEGERRSERLIEAGLEAIAAEDGVRVDYLAVVDAETLLPVETAVGGALVAVAAYVGSTRLIDNFVVA